MQLVTANLFYAEHMADAVNPPDARIARILRDLTVVKIWCRGVAQDYLRDDAEGEYIVGRIAQIEQQLRVLAEYGI